ncbi:MAG: UPF0182 protein [Fimbriimonadales bacterium]
MLSEHRQEMTRGRKVGIFLLVVLVLVIAFGGAATTAYMNWLWFLEDARQPQVFAVRFNTRLLLFAIGFVVSFLFLGLNVAGALRSFTIIHPGVDHPAREFFTVLMRAGRGGILRVAWILVAVLAVLFGLGLRGQWENLLVFLNATPFGKTDPIFGADISFYAFRLPLLESLAGSAFFLSLLTLLAVGGIYLVGRAIAGFGRAHLSIPRATPQLNLLAAATLALLGCQVWLARYGFLYAGGSLFTGPGAADVSARLPVLALIAYLCWALAAVFAFGAWSLRRFHVHGYGLGALVLVWIVGYLVYPGMLQATVVSPNELEKESPFIKHAIDYTRSAYMLDRIRVVNWQPRAEPTAEDLQAAAGTLENMRLWDYRVINDTYDGLQVIKQYYRFREVDVDRYRIDGKQRMVNIGARELDTDGLGPGAKTWQNLRFQYTHGMGVVLNPVNSADPEGRPNFIVADLPPKYPPDLPVKESRLYYTEGPGNPVFVHSQIAEISAETEAQPDGQNLAPAFPGNRGIAVGSFFRRLLVSAALSEFSVITTEAFTPRSKVLLRRNIMERAYAVYPFLTFDGDPYPVIADGRVYWMMDGYTTTNRYPYAAHSGGSDYAPNYIRNSVKVVIDAATGAMTAYNFDDQDPILKTYLGIYPGLVKPRSAMPQSLQAHIRYPEDLFMAQCNQLQLYHIQDPKVWYQKEDRWSLPKESTEEGGDRPMEAYYCQLRVPDDDKDSFILMLPFTPLGRPNLSAWLAAHCDPDRFGELVLYRFPRTSSLVGPKQASNIFYQNEEISQWATLVGQRGSRVRRGNLLVVPVGNSILYVEPLYLQAAGDRPIPELKKVALATQRRAVVGDTYAEALARLFGDQAPRVEGSPPPKPGAKAQPAAEVPKESPEQMLSRALAARAEAKQALAKQDWAGYGAAQQKLDEALQALQRHFVGEAEPRR